MKATTEDFYTPPSTWCPAPVWWHSDAEDADSTEDEVIELVGGFIRAMQPQLVVETGTASGACAEVIGQALQRNGHGRLYTLEIVQAAAEQAEYLLRDLPVTVAHIDSLQWWPPANIDFAWIDSGPANVRCEEIRRWKQMFNHGAIIGVHDSAPTMGREHTLRGVLGIAEEFDWQILTLRTPRGVSFLQVP